MPDFSKRSSSIEIMDDLQCDGEVVYQTLRELEFINRWLGGNQVTLNALNKLLKKISTGEELVIVDLGCGSGDMLRLIHQWANKRSLKVKLIGYDANPNIIQYARENLRDFPAIQLETMDIFSDEFKKQKFDVVIGTLFYHHFTENQLTSFFNQLKDQTRIGFIINDIHRHWLAYYSIKWLTHSFSNSAMVKYDAPLSVLRAFHRKELSQILETASVNPYSIQWKWAFRWQVISKSKVD